MKQKTITTAAAVQTRFFAEHPELWEHAFSKMQYAFDAGVEDWEAALTSHRVLVGMIDAERKSMGVVG